MINFVLERIEHAFIVWNVLYFSVCAGYILIV